MFTPKEIGLVGFTGASASHISNAADAFAAAALEDGFGGRVACYKVWILAPDGEAFMTEGGFSLQPQRSLQEAPELDTIIVAGGQGALQPAVQSTVAEWIMRRAFETRRIASICSGIYVLAPTGLLEERETTTHWKYSRDLRLRYPGLRVDHKRRLVKDGNIYTSAGLTAGLHLALALIEEDYGKQVALLAGRNLMTYLEPASQAGPTADQEDEISRSTERLGDLVSWIIRNLHQSLTVDVLARRAGMCPSHFTRAFKSVFGITPGDYVENLRLNEAQRRLSSRHKTLRSVAASVGFADASAFRRAYARRFGKLPRPRPVLKTAKS